MLTKTKALLLYLAYNFVWAIISIPFLIILIWRYRHYPSHRQRFLERLGIYSFSPVNDSRRSSKEPAKKFWIHLASVGEVMAALPLLKSLEKEYGLDQLTVTTTTPTGEQALKQYFNQNIEHQYLPFDFSLWVNLLIKRINADCLVIFETELWPSLIASCQKSDIRTLVVNARLSEKSYKKYLKLSSFTKMIFSRLTSVAVQTISEAERFKNLGVKKIVVTGNIKSEVTISETLKEKAKYLRGELIKNGKQKVIVAASTHEGEEEIILSAFKEFNNTQNQLLLILTPRHPKRTQSVKQLCINKNLNVLLKSDNETPSNQTDVLLVDTVGELFLLFGIGDIAIMGGTFIDRGGHNFLEPAAWGLPIVSGSSDYNFLETAKCLAAVGALKQLKDSDSLSKEVLALLGKPEEREKMGLAGKEYVENNKGALDKTLLFIKNNML
jgi:3-deoxy-D-manno-octulosonic-acid transferase